MDFPTIPEIKNGTVLSAVLPASFLVEVYWVYVCDATYDFHVLVSRYLTFLIYVNKAFGDSQVECKYYLRITYII